MNAPGTTLTRTLRSDLSEVAALADAVAAWAEQLRIPQAATSAMTLMLEELVTNSIRHGYAEGGAGSSIDVRLETDGEALVASVSDSAPPFNPLDLPAADTASAIDERAVGGLGVHRVRRLAHSMDYRRVDGRNVVRVVRRFSTDAAARN